MIQQKPYDFDDCKIKLDLIDCENIYYITNKLSHGELPLKNFKY